MAKIRAWGKNQEAGDNEFHEAIEKALRTLDKKESDSWKASMKRLENVLNETLVKVKSWNASLEKPEENVRLAIEDVTDLAEVRNQLIPEAKKAWADLLM